MDTRAFTGALTVGHGGGRRLRRVGRGNGWADAFTSLLGV
jgi:hypothetical protein